MDYHEYPCQMEFLDWTGVEDHERNRVLRFFLDDSVKIPGKPRAEAAAHAGDHIQQPYHNQEPIRNAAPQTTHCYPPPHVTNSNHMYVAATVVQPIYSTQGYQMPVAYAAYPGHGNHSASNFPNKLNQNPVPHEKNIVTVNNYIPQGSVAMPVAQTVILQKPPPLQQGNVSMQPVIMPQPYVTVAAASVSVNAHVANNVRPVQVNAQQIVAPPPQQPAAPTANAHVANVPAALPPQASNSNNSTKRNTASANAKKQVETPVIKQNGADSNTTPPQNNKSWASLFNKGKNNEDGKAKEVVVNGCNKNVESSPVITEEYDHEFAAMKKKLREKYDEPTFYRIGETLATHVLESRTISLQPRGLINRSNYCYINSILQALMACPPMYNLLCCMSKDLTNGKELIPMISGMSRLVKEFHHLPAGQRVGRRIDKNLKKEQNYVSINCDVPFEPSWIYKLLSGKRSDSFIVEGRQEDAEEFLGCLLNGLNDEMLDLIKLVSRSMPKAVNSDNGPDQDDQWQVMGPKNKGSITRRTEFNRTPISSIFGGLLRSRIHKTGEQDTDNIQPFFTLQLNIEDVTSVKEALEALVSKNQLEGVTSSRTNEEVEAWQQVTIEELPVVLVLHLKCFDFKLDGCTKILKALEFPVDLKIDNKLLSSKSSLSVKEKQYKLFAVVYHDGKEATKGHYVTDAYHVGYASWLRYDDASVKAVQEEHVLKPQGTRVPYLLFYRRSDSIKSK